MPLKWGEQPDKKLKQNKPAKKTKAIATEKKLAKRLGGFAQPNSGAFRQYKGDVSLDDFLIDSKQTESNSISITRQMVIKITQEANESNKEPCLVLTFEKLVKTVANQWAVIPLAEFKKLLDNAKK